MIFAFSFENIPTVQITKEIDDQYFEISFLINPKHTNYESEKKSLETFVNQLINQNNKIEKINKTQFPYYKKIGVKVAINNLDDSMGSFLESIIDYFNEKNTAINIPYLNKFLLDDYKELKQQNPRKTPEVVIVEYAERKNPPHRLPGFDYSSKKSFLEQLKLGNINVDDAYKYLEAGAFTAPKVASECLEAVIDKIYQKPKVFKRPTKKNMFGFEEPREYDFKDKDEFKTYELYFSNLENIAKVIAQSDLEGLEDILFELRQKIGLSCWDFSYNSIYKPINVKNPAYQSLSEIHGSIYRKANIPDYKNYNDCEVLGLSAEEAKDPKLVRAAYIERARKFHPDKNPNDPQAEEKFKAVQASYEKLANKNNPREKFKL